jgi:hypothetical protein
MALAIPVLWFLPDLVGSGSLTRGVHWAQYAKASSPARAGCPFCAELTQHASPLLGAPFKVGVALACLGLVGARARPALRWLVGIGVAWILEEALFTQAGFSGSDRYLIAPMTVLIVAGGAGWAAVLKQRRWWALGVGLVSALLITFATPWSGPHLARAVDGIRNQAQVGRDLRSAVAQAGGARRLETCGPVQTNPSLVPVVAWRLGTPMRTAESASGRVVVQAPNGPRAPSLPQPPAGYRMLAQSGVVRIFTACG